MKITFLVAILSILASCTRVDPAPEAKDPIYADLSAELAIAEKNVESVEKSLEKLRTELERAVPQTGQVKFATKKVRDAEATLAELRQRKLYFDVKRDRRKAYVQFRYQQSLKPGGPPWPDQKEIDEYRTLAKLNREKLEWDRNKGVKKDVPRGTKVESEKGSAE